MTNWTKIKNKGQGAMARANPAVHRSGKTTFLVLPAAMVTASRADVLSDGNGRIAFRQHDDGDRVVAKSAGVTMRISIPSEFAGCIPNGTTDVDLAVEGDLLVLDLNAIGGDA